MKISIPISYKTINEKSLPEYAEQLGRCGAERVFICFIGSVFTSGGALSREPERLGSIIKYFKDRGFEVGVWIDTLGHGRPLYSDLCDPELENYQPIVGLDGNSTPYGLCPIGEKFISALTDGISRLASLSPDIIMLDDDFRFNRGAAYYMGCFCPEHMKIYSRIIGEELSKEEISLRIFSGGKNKYRDAFMDMLGSSLEALAGKIRAAVDRVDPGIRIGACSVRESADYNGTSPERIARILAGGTKPFTRTSGAPYGTTDIIPAIEFTRMQTDPLSLSGIETMTEGDTYPRPRYNCSYRQLFLYNLAISASSRGTGRLDYIIDYNHKPSYEAAYAERYADDAPILKAVREMFSGLRPSGIRIINKQHKLREWQLPEAVDRDLAARLSFTAENPAASLIAKNSFPTCYEGEGYPIALIGENARGIDRAALKGGAIIDCAAARILEDEGIDVGLASAESICAAVEYFIAAEDGEPDIDGGALLGMKVKDGAVVHSVYLSATESANAAEHVRLAPAASYSYTNKDGEKFLVLGIDRYLSKKCPNFDNSYHRQAEIEGFIRRCGVALPAFSAKNPNLYIIASRGEGEMAVLLLNIHADEIRRPKITLEGEYSEIEFIGCSGELSGSTVSLSEICPFGYAAFKVKR